LQTPAALTRKLEIDKAEFKKRLESAGIVCHSAIQHHNVHPFAHGSKKGWVLAAL
jgi:hypothetical protein